MLEAAEFENEDITDLISKTFILGICILCILG